MKHLARTFWPSLPVPPEDEHECNPSRGIILGVVLGLAMWALLICVALTLPW